MLFHTIDITSHPDFNLAWALYERAFPTVERRTKQEQEQEIILKKEAYSFMACYEEDAFIGILGFWEIDSYVFIEHFAIDDALRGEKYGSKILTDFLQHHKNIFLEIDLPVCDTSKRRLKFYENLGFVQNDIKHFQVPFRKNNVLLPLAILTWKTPLKKKVYKTLYKKMYHLLPTL